MIDDGVIGVVLLEPGGQVLHADENAERLLPLVIDAPFGGDFRRDEGLATMWRRLSRSLSLLTDGCGTPPPRESRTNAWGTFDLRASWLQRPGAGGSGMVAVTVRLRVPRKLKLWRAIHLLGLSPRQQEVTLLFAEGMSQNDIAARLRIARTTVIDHIRRLYDRLAIPPDREALRAHLLARIHDNWDQVTRQ
jgi:DNA-binding CsgD family transcriptional regulator